MPDQEAIAVVDLGFGDSGKGVITDALVRRHGARSVIRFNGGAQAGHNVVTESGRHHTFSQFGAGSFVPGVLTFLGRDVVVHPLALAVEAEKLAQSGVDDGLARLCVHREARLITPYHQALGRARELSRGDGRHGTCGIGFGETVADSLEEGAPVLHAKDLEDRQRSLAILEEIRERKIDDAEILLRRTPDPRSLREELALLEWPQLNSTWVDAVRPVLESLTLDDGEALRRRLSEGGSTILEGAQGMLIDERFGFHPHTTWSDCRFTAAEALLREHGFEGSLKRLGVLRTYLTRHGEGPLLTETTELDAITPEPHNLDGGWQGRFRRGWPDLVLARYAAEASGGVDALALTHADALERREGWKVATGHRSERGETIDALTLPASIDEAEALGSRLASCEPILEDVASNEEGGALRTLVAKLEDAVGAEVALVASGPTANDVRGR